MTFEGGPDLEPDDSWPELRFDSSHSSAGRARAERKHYRFLVIDHVLTHVMRVGEALRTYDVVFDFPTSRGTCSCPGYQFGDRVPCLHLWLVRRAIIAGEITPDSKV